MSARPSASGQAAFEAGGSFGAPSVGEVAAAFSPGHTAGQFDRAKAVIASCGQVTFAIGGGPVSGSVAADSLPAPGGVQEFASYEIRFQGGDFGGTLALFEVGSYLGEVIYLDFAPPEMNLFEADLSSAIMKLS